MGNTYCNPRAYDYAGDILMDRMDSFLTHFILRSGDHFIRYLPGDRHSTNRRRPQVLTFYGRLYRWRPDALH